MQSVSEDNLQQRFKRAQKDCCDTSVSHRTNEQINERTNERTKKASKSRL